VSPRNMLDPDGQPHSGFQAQLRTRPAIEEMLGLCRGLIFDGDIRKTEATALADWVRQHREIADIWPASVVARRLAGSFIHGMITTSERARLQELLERVEGTDPLTASEAEWSHYLALNEPPPPIVIPDKRFCFIGNFFFGTRQACGAAVIDRGGEVLDAVRRDLDYLVIGLVGGRDWIQVAHGGELQQAISYRSHGGTPAIVSEKHWAAQLMPVRD
jgi:hypothetical protein